MTDPSRPRTIPGRLTRRADYLTAAKGRRYHTPRLTLQGIERTPGSGDVAGPRFGLTVSRKVGTATERNRVKRRLRAALRQLADHAGPGLAGKDCYDYVVVARRDILSAEFPTLIQDIATAIGGLDKPRSTAARNARKPRESSAPTLPRETR